MIEYSLKKNAAIIEFEDSVYPYPIILEAAHNFLEGCWVTLEKKGKRYILGIESKEDDEASEIISAFFNFMNGLIFSKISEEANDDEKNKGEDECRPEKEEC
jgi:hypothetical protein